jgi:MFS family permease
MVSLKVWAHRPIAVSNAVSLFSGMTTIGLTTFLPMYVQAVLGRSAVIAGLTLTVMVLGWPITATYAARNLVRFGLRPILIAGCLLMPIGASLFLLLHAGSSPWLAGAASLIMGFGMGCLSTAGMVIVQNAVGWAERGAATASQMFTRSLGSTVGAALLGGVLNISLAARGSTVKSDQIRDLLDKAGRPGGMETVRAALDQALHITFWGVFVLALLTFLVSLLAPTVRIGGPEDSER